MVIYTTAPVDFDYPYVKVLDALAGRTRPLGNSAAKIVRKVEVPEDKAAFQCGRYLSACIHLVTDEVGWQRRLSFGLVEAKE